MPASDLSIAEQIAEHHRRNSTEGRFLRYARGRLRYFAARQIAVFMAGLTVGAMVSAKTGAAFVAILLAGELIDCAFLAQVPVLLRRGWPVGRTIRLATATAGIQAGTACTCILWLGNGAEMHATSFFAMSYLAGAAINAGMVLDYCRPAAEIRLSFFAMTGTMHFFFELAHARDGGLHALYDLSGLAMTLFVVTAFLGAARQHDRRHQADRIELLHRSAELDQARQALESSQRESRRLALVAQYANDSVILSDRARRITWVNAAFERITGYSREQAVGQTPDSLLDGPDTDPEVGRRIGAAVDAGRPIREEVLNYARDGRPIWMETNVVPVLDAEGRIDTVVSVERDITSAKEREALLAAAKQAAEEGARAKAAFLATVSHEIRTPMNAIIGMAELLAGTSLSKAAHAQVTTIRDSAEALLKILNDVLDFSKLNAGKLTIGREPFSPAACLGAAADLLRPGAREKGLYLDLCHDTPLPPLVLGDPGRVRQILVNLLGNAVKFTHTGGVTLRAVARTSGSAIQLSVEVQDTGIGIPRDRATRIFEQFEQADSRTTREYGGTGLGLAISRSLARQMGGDLTLVGGAARGACFRLDLTLEPAPVGARVKTAKLPLPAEKDQIAGLRVLLADDNETNRLLVQHMLRDDVARLILAQDGQAAVQAVRAEKPDVVLMDMSMPGLDGIAATRTIRAGAGHQPWIVALTAHAFDSDRTACLSAGMNDFLTKPVRRDCLVQALCHAATHLPDWQKPLGPGGMTGVSPDSIRKEADPWTSPPASGTTSGRSTPSSGP